MRSYQVDLRCPNCGQVHRVSNDLRLDHGPTQPGTLADLPNDLVWCDQSAAYIQLQDPSVIAPMMLD